MSQSSEVNTFQIFPNRSSQSEESQIQPRQIQQIWIRKVFKINNKEFTYDGPKNHVVDELIAVLEQLEIQDKKKQNQQHGRLIELINKISKKILFQFIIFNYQIKFDVSQLILTIIYWSVFIYMLVESINFNNKEIVKNNQQLINYLPFIVFLYTLGCQIFSYFNNKIIWFILFIFLFIIPSFILLDYYQDYIDNNQQNNQQIGISFCLLCLIIFFKSIFNQIIRRNFKRNILLLTQTLINCSFYVFSTVFIYFRIIKLFIITDIQINQSLLKIILEDIKVFLFIFLLFYQAILIKDQSRITFKQVFYDLVKVQKKNQIPYQITLFKWYFELELYFEDKCEKLPIYQPAIATLWFVSLQIILFYILNQELKSETNNNDLVVSVTFTLFVPLIHLLFGALLQNRNLFGDNKNNFFWFPLISNILSLIFTKLWFLVKLDQRFQYCSQTIGLFQTVYISIQLILKVVQSHQRVKKSFYDLHFMYLVVVPFLILLPFSEMSKKYALKVISWILFSIGLTPLGLYFFYYYAGAWQCYQQETFREVCKNPLVRRACKSINYLDLNYSYSLLLLISLMQVILFQMLTYVIFYQDNQKYKGLAIGFQIINFILFLCNSNYIYYNIYEQEQNFQFGERGYIRLSNRFYKKIIKLINFGSYISFFFFLTLYFIIFNEIFRFIFLVLTFCIPITSLYFKYLKQLQIFGKALDSSNFLFFLIFELISFILILSILQTNTSDNSEDFQINGQLLINQFMFALIFFMIKIAIYYQDKYQEENSEMGKKFIELLAEYQIVMSKKMFKKIHSSRMKKPNDWDIKIFFQEDYEVALLYYQRKDQEQFVYLFISEIYYQWHSLIKSQENKNIFEKIQDFVYKIFEDKQIIFDIKTRKEFQRINLQKQEVDQLIKEMYELEESRQEPLVLQKDSENSKCCDLSFIKSQNYCKLAKHDEFQLRDQNLFVDAQQIEIYLDLQQFLKFDLLCKIIDSTYLQVYEKGKEEIVFENFAFNFSNLLTLFFRVLDYFSFASVPLDYLILEKSEVGKINFLYKYVDFSFIFDNFYFQFYLSLTITILYLIFGLFAIKLVYKKLYGCDDEGNQAKFWSWRYWLSKIILVLNIQCIFVSKTFLNIFVCDLSAQPLTVFVESSIICMSETHFKYIILSLIGLFIFFPLSAFLYPILQYEDKSTNLRFEPPYVVYYMLAKLLIVGVQVVQTTQQAQLNLLNWDSNIVLLLILALYIRDPCKILFYNTIELLFLLEIQIFFLVAGNILSNVDLQVWQLLLIWNGIYGIIIIVIGSIKACLNKILKE